MQINVVKADQHTAIRLQGRFDFNTHRDFRASVELALQESPAQLQVDLGGVDYLDSSALGMLLMLRDKAIAVNKTVALV
ncbi:MAG: STAS domain-containing protein, partial [Proteobacteria bacterium]|nr:STAS domain-containing protein [Pseudomonadota bacterium]